MYCRACGVNIGENVSFCPHCGVKTGIGTTPTYVNEEAKSRVVAGVLALFFGGLGIHNFYLGYNDKAVAQLLLSTLGLLILIGPLIAGVWAFIEAIQLFTGGIRYDAKGELLKD
jgi:TM2 domain-containing membrane protein YozV